MGGAISGLMVLVKGKYTEQATESQPASSTFPWWDLSVSEARALLCCAEKGRGCGWEFWILKNDPFPNHLTVGSCVSQRIKQRHPPSRDKARPTVCLAISGFPLWLEGLRSPSSFSGLHDLSAGEPSLSLGPQLFMEPLLSSSACGVSQQKKKQPNHFRKSHAGFPLCLRHVLNLFSPVFLLGWEEGKKR